MDRYPNLFRELGIPEESIHNRIEEVFQQIFMDPEERFYMELPGNMGYMLDTGNLDVRTEGMSYGMMMAVQRNRRDIFDRLWLFAVTYMRQESGKYAGYFAWSVQPDGRKNSQGPAPDGEEYFALALLFAANRWGDGPPPFDYGEQARELLHHCLHQEELTEGGSSMWEAENHFIRFVPEARYSDPSYHLPHFYALFALYAREGDRGFWERAAEASRGYVSLCCHPVTGLAPEYAEYDGTPRVMFGKNQLYYSDAYRVPMNLGLEAAWFGRREAATDIANRIQAFFSENTRLGEYDSYLLDGTPLGIPAMHPTAIIAVNAAASLVSDGPYRMEWVRHFWELPLRKGTRRYYDNCLYFFCLLMLAGEYRMY